MFIPRKRGFTVVELLVVIAIIGVLVALLLPAVQMAREAARRAQCIENMKQCATAISSYASSKGQLPPSRSVVNIGGSAEVLNWVYPVLSELEQTPVHNQIRTGTLPPATTIKVLMCPSQVRFESTDYPLSYVVNGGRANYTSGTIINADWIENGVFVDNGVAGTTNPAGGTRARHRIEDIAKYDGTSNTLMLSENPNVVEWLRAGNEQRSQMLWFPQGYQKDPTYDPAFVGALNKDVNTLTTATFDTSPMYGRPGSFHPGGFNVAMCDGAVRWFGDTTDYGVYAVLMTSRGERANDPANASFTVTDPLWQSATHTDYPGTKFD